MRTNQFLIKYLTLFILLLSTSFVFSQAKTLHDLKATTINGEIFDFVSLKGKKVLIVNTASECALTPQFKKLQELYEEYGGDDFEIIGFPCNDFGRQEPSDNNQILEFCTNKYGVTFPMMEKIFIKGENKHPVYKWLTNSKENGTLDAEVKWNFQKFMVDEKGIVVDFVAPITSPSGKKIINWLKENL
ncbi:MAG: glutathione peroxidase [Prolixibacteraceae bacterium]|jgi:glutathione peroxidase|nr:glutathione peroxidase [Prolixibacteraceae bacterium]MBT6007277.1 glutathione peroxidase [Prolixibacteraceae bacterium]MBT6765871.1 glutathione peroxidase [Prolixibacteraceae bacterium]MBT6997656.1 glutathione peroxidase [Prolixibacteraceae bacterium]MBT7396726.1 glutathione peroxidase [Prolixibacteraceae bacterium]